MTDFQTRIAQKHDNIRRKIIDRNMQLSGHLTDSIRVKYKKNKEGDIISRIVTEANVVPIQYPPMKDVPIRDIQKINGQYTITSLIAAVGAMDQEVPQHYVIQAPRKDMLQVGDLIFRVLMDPDMLYPTVMGLELTDKLGTFGANSLILCSYKCAIYMEDLPQKMIDIITEIAKRRLHLQY